MRRRAGIGLVTIALALGACQSVDQNAIEAEALNPDTLADEAVPVGPGASLTVETGDLFFVYDGVSTQNADLEIEAAEGEIEITLENIGAAEHNFRVDEAVGDVKKVEAVGGETQTGTLALFPGNYTFYCDIAGHRAAGMVGTLIVVPAAEADQIGGGTEAPTEGTDGPTEAETSEPAATETSEPAATEEPTEPGPTETSS